MKKILLVDGNSVFFRAYYSTLKGRPMTTSQGLPTNAVFGFIRLLQKAVKDYAPDAMLVAWDAGKPTFRHEKFEAYKGTRKPLDQELIDQMPVVREFLDASHIVRYEEPGYEADDIIGSMAKSCPDMQTYILTSDKDLLQLIDKTTTVVLMKKGLTEVEVMDEAALMDTYGLQPKQIIDLKGLMGDPSDNIPGVHGVGEKTALKLLQSYGSVEGVYEHLDEVKGKMKEKLAAGHESALLSKELATIYTGMKLPFSLENLQLHPEEPDDFYEKYEMHSLIGKSKVSSVEVSCREEETVPADVLDWIVPVATEGGFTERTCYGFVLLSKDGPVFVSKENASKDEGLKEALQNKSWNTWDAKELWHACRSLNLPLPQVTNDVHLEGFLLHSQATNPDDLTKALGIYLPETFKELSMKSKGGSTQERCIPVYASLLVQAKDKQASLEVGLKEEDIVSLYKDLELPVAKVLFDMECNGIRVNKESLAQLKEEYETKLLRLRDEIYAQAGHPFNIDSPKQLGQVLYDELGLAEGKKRSTAAEVLESLAAWHPIVPLILEYRKYSKLLGTYLSGLSRYIVDGKIHTTFNQTMTQTGRLSSSEPNLQNISVRDEEGRAVRSIFEPRPGWLLLSADYSQIELRVLADMAKEERMIQAFQEDADIHTRTATVLFGVPADEVTDAMRRTAKTVNFGIIYGQTDFGLSQTLGISRKDAKEFMRLYFEKYPNIRGYMDSVVDFCKENGYVETLLKRRRWIPEIKDKAYMVREFGKRAAMNAPIQGTAADLIKKAMLDVSKRMEEEQVQSRMLLQIHDELILEVPPEEKDKMEALVLEAMDNAMRLSVPLKASIHWGTNWAEAK